MMEKEMKYVLNTDIEKQYEYFIKKVADFGEVWSLKDLDGWVTLGVEEDEFFPIWPKKEFAEICIGEEWKDCYAESIDLEDFLDDWITGLKEENIRITVMWNNGSGIDREWDRLREDIEIELEKY